ncbi:MAG: hypothetical protein WBI17_11245 [Clostridiaceae bacterium]
MMETISYFLFPVLAGLFSTRLLKEKSEGNRRILVLPSLCLIFVAFLLKFSVLNTLFYSLFLISAVTDSLTGEVYEIGLYLLAPVSLVLFYSESSYIAAFFIILIPLYRKSVKLQYYFGEGDLWILLFISMAYGRSVFYSLVYASILGLGYTVIRRKKEVYFVPFLYLGLLLSNINEINKLFLIY